MLDRCHGQNLERGMEDVKWPIQDLDWREPHGQVNNPDSRCEREEGLVCPLVRIYSGRYLGDSTLPDSLQNVGLRKNYTLLRMTKESHLDWISSLKRQEGE